jgi:hypothetical protein
MKEVDVAQFEVITCKYWGTPRIYVNQDVWLPCQDLNP